MEKIKKVMEEKTIKEYYCDVCGVKMSRRRCIFCRRDVCNNDRYAVDLTYDLSIPSFTGDYPDYICRTCWTKGEKFREKITVIRKESDDKEEQLFDEWEKECKNGRS